MAQILENGGRAGEFSVSNSRQSAEIITQMFYGPRAWLLHKRDNTLDADTYRLLEQSAKAIAEIILNGIRNRK